MAEGVSNYKCSKYCGEEIEEALDPHFFLVHCCSFTNPLRIIDETSPSVPTVDTRIVDVHVNSFELNTAARSSQFTW